MSDSMNTWIRSQARRGRVLLKRDDENAPEGQPRRSAGDAGAGVGATPPRTKVTVAQRMNNFIRVKAGRWTEF